MKACEPYHYRGVRRPRGQQGDQVLLILECNFCSYYVSRSQVLPGRGFARANRMHGTMQSHVRHYHADRLQDATRRAVDAADG